GVGTHPPRPRGTELVGHSPKNPKSGSSLQSQASPEGEPEAAALPHSRACSCLLLLLLPCLPHRAAQWPPPVPLHGDHWAWGRRDLKQLGRQRAGTPARLVITAQAGDCLASCITAWAHCLGLGSPSGAGVTIWGWGHHLGLGSLSGGWQQEGQRDGWRVMLQISPLSPTERAHHAHEKVRDEDLSQWDTLVVMSGDGLLFEVVNGLMERPDWREAMKKPLCILPGGSGNALAASINYYAGGCQCLHHNLCLCLESASALEQWPPLLPPALRDTVLCSKGSIHSNPGCGHSSSLPCPTHSSQHLSAPQIGTCPTSLQPGGLGEQGWSCCR
uniref:Sphingosine kinase 1 n=1 Tax=Zonotrichia albicollis TaxID=44394 RepID=A0A8D2N818_ZONAL